MKRKSDFILQNVAGETILVPLGEEVINLNGLIILNATAFCMWELLEQERSLDELAEAVVEKFDVPPTTARADVQIFLDEIARMGLLEA